MIVRTALACVQMAIAMQRRMVNLRKLNDADQISIAEELERCAANLREIVEGSS